MDRPEKTVLIRRIKGRIQRRRLLTAAESLRRGGIVVFPTETVYGMGADALNAAAVSRVFSIKGRPLDNPVIVHVADRSEVDRLCIEVPEKAGALMDMFWPGPLTLVLRKSDAVPGVVTGNLDTVSVRMPSNEIALSLIRSARTPVAAPSANLSGRPSITAFVEAVSELKGKVDFIIDGGRSRIGVESTVIDMTHRIPRLLRPGGLPVEEIELAVGRISIHPSARGFTEYRGATTPSPGMKYRHYAPEHSRVLLFEKQPRVGLAISRTRDRLYASGHTVAMLLTDETPISGGVVLRLGSRKEPEVIARRLFSSLRKLDRSGFDYILAEGIADEGIGMAVMNRLRRASAVPVHTAGEEAGRRRKTAQR